VDELCDLDGTPLTTRNDDRSDVITERLTAYESQTKPLANYYRVQQRLVAVNADQTVMEVSAQVFGVIDSYSNGCRPPAQ